MVLFAPGNPGSPDTNTNPIQITKNPDTKKINKQAQQILLLTKIIQELKKRISNLEQKPSYQQIQTLEFKIVKAQRTNTRLKILALIISALGLWQATSNCQQKLDNLGQQPESTIDKKE